MSDDSWLFRRRAQTHAHRRARRRSGRGRSSRHGTTSPRGASICRVQPAAETGPADAVRPCRRERDRRLRRSDCIAGRQTPTIAYKSAHFHKTFGTDLPAVGPHTEIFPIQCRGRPSSAAAAASCQRRDRRDRGPHARSGLPGRASGPGPAGEPCAARNRGRRAARPILRRRLSC